MTWSKATLLVAAALIVWLGAQRFAQIYSREDLGTDQLGTGGIDATELARLAGATGPTDILMYTTTECPYCKQARTWLTENGFAFTECDAQAREQCARELEDLDAEGVPYLIVRGKELDAGFDVDELVAALR